MKERVKERVKEREIVRVSVCVCVCMCVRMRLTRRRWQEEGRRDRKVVDEVKVRIIECNVESSETQDRE